MNFGRTGAARCCAVKTLLAVACAAAFIFPGRGAVQAFVLSWSYPEMSPEIRFNVYSTTNYLWTNVGPVFDSISIESEDTNAWVFLRWETNVIEKWKWDAKPIVTTTNLSVRVVGEKSFALFVVTASNVVNRTESPR